MSNVLTARELGEAVGLKHIEVIRRIRKGQIRAEKMGWVYVIDREEIERVKTADWYTRLMARREEQTA